MVTGDEDADVEVEDAGEGQHEMLAVPHGEDHRGEMDVTAVGVLGVEAEAARRVDEAEIVDGKPGDGVLDEGCPQQPRREPRRAARRPGYRLARRLPPASRLCPGAGRLRRPVF